MFFYFKFNPAKRQPITFVIKANPMKRQPSVIFALIVYFASIALMYAQQPAGGPPGGGQRRGGMGLIAPTVINPTDNSTSMYGGVEHNQSKDKYPSEGSDLILTKDIVYHQSTDSEGKPLEMKMDIITHTGNAKLPVVIFITGGGFMFGLKEGELYKRSEIAKEGFVVASITYHVISNGIYSDAVKDVKAAVRYLRAHAKDYGIDASHIALWGESAGGYLSASAYTDTEFEVGENLDQSSAVQACIDSFGLSDLTKIGADYDDEAMKAHFTLDSPDGKYIHGKNSGLNVFGQTR